MEKTIYSTQISSNGSNKLPSDTLAVHGAPKHQNQKSTFKNNLLKMISLVSSISSAGKRAKVEKVHDQSIMDEDLEEFVVVDPANIFHTGTSVANSIDGFVDLTSEINQGHTGKSIEFDDDELCELATFHTRTSLANSTDEFVDLTSEINQGNTGKSIECDDNELCQLATSHTRTFLAKGTDGFVDLTSEINQVKCDDELATSLTAAKLKNVGNPKESINSNNELLGTNQLNDKSASNKKTSIVNNNQHGLMLHEALVHRAAHEEELSFVATTL